MGLLLLGAPGLYAAGRSAFSFLLIPPGARASAMGGSYAGVASGAETLSVNPAGLADEIATQLSFQLLFFVDGILYDNVFFIHPTRKGAWGAQAGFLGVGGLKRTVADPSVQDGFRETGDFTTQHIQAALSFGQRITKGLDLGLTARFARESLSDASANAAGLDLGLVYRRGGSPVKLGLAVQHLGSQVKFKNESYELPRLIRAGVSVRRPKESALRWVPEKTLATLETVRLIDGGDQSIAGGAEVPLFERKLALRMGYHYFLKKQSLGSNLSLPSGFAFGLGFQHNLWSFDYAANSFGELGLAHRLSLSLKFASQ